MSLNTITNQTIALAGIAQSSAIVQQLARTGNTDQSALKASISSLFINDEQGIVNVYGDLSGISLGMKRLAEQLASIRVADPEQSRYAATLIYLENQLSQRPKMLETIFIGIERARVQSEHFGLLHENVLVSLGDVYFSTISTLQPRIMINGEQEYLSRADTVNKIRSCLLAGIRAVILWRHCGGSRWKFLFYRKKIQHQLKILQQQI